MRADAPPGAQEARPGPAGQPPAAAELYSAAPVIGSVHPVPVHTLGVGAVHRPAAVAIDSARAGDLHVAGASLIGLSHLMAGGVRQDAYNFVATADGLLVAVAADGLGSRALSQVGVSFFCTGVLQAAVSGCTSAAELLRAGADHAETAAKSLYRLTADDIGFVAAVAVFGVPGPDGARDAEIARVGDVSAFALDDGRLVELFAADDEPVNVVRASLPGRAAPEVVHSTASMIALATDGLAVDLRTSPGVRKWLGERWATPLGPHAFGDTLRYQRQGSHDDRTAVAVWRLSAIQAADDGQEQPAEESDDAT